jgi:hypothetical protein
MVHDQLALAIRILPISSLEYHIVQCASGFDVANIEVGGIILCLSVGLLRLHGANVAGTQSESNCSNLYGNRKVTLNDYVPIA